MRLPDTFIRGPNDILYEHVYSFEYLFICTLPIEVIVPGGRRKSKSTEYTWLTGFVPSQEPVI